MSIASTFNLEAYRGRRVLITGHTGFKGSWMVKVLLEHGAIVAGYSLEPPTEPSLFKLLNLSKNITHIIGDVRDFEKMKALFDSFKPEIVLHLAAQPLVRESYKDPRHTYETNVMGTVNICECVRQSKSVKSFLNVTTDKVYRNNEWEWGYRENEPLDGFDPYSNSKSCSELVTHSYINSFFKEMDLPVSTARAGNVIGGGDFSKDRIIPDCVRAQVEGKEIVVRNPHSTRPYQHVLDPVITYLMIAIMQESNHDLAGFYNVGPDDCDCVTTGELVNLFCRSWGDDAKWIDRSEPNAPHEANFLKLDCSKLKSVFGWKPQWHITDAVSATCEWSKAWIAGQDLHQVMKRQLESYLKGESYE